MQAPRELEAQRPVGCAARGLAAEQLVGADPEDLRDLHDHLGVEASAILLVVGDERLGDGAIGDRPRYSTVF